MSRAQAGVRCILCGHWEDKVNEAAVIVLPGDATDREIAAALVDAWSIEDPEFEYDTNSVTSLESSSDVIDLLDRYGIWVYVEEPRVVEVSAS